MDYLFTFGALIITNDYIHHTNSVLLIFNLTLSFARLPLSLQCVDYFKYLFFFERTTLMDATRLAQGVFMVTRELTRKRAWAAWTAAQTADRQIERQPRAQAQNDQPRSKAKRRPRRAHSEQMREEAVPSTPLQRVVGFGSLAVQMAFGAASEQVSRAIGSKEASDSVWLNDANAQLLSQTLCKIEAQLSSLARCSVFKTTWRCRRSSQARWSACAKRR